MKIHAQCIPCILEVRSREILNSNLSEEEKKIAMIKLIKYVAEIIRLDSSTTYIASEAFKLVKKLIGDRDPYRDYKKMSREMAYKYLPKILKLLEDKNGFEKFRMHSIISVNANILDPGVPSLKNASLMIEKILEEPVIDDTKKFYEKVLDSRKIVYLLDNCGEAIFDKLFIDHIADMGKEIYAIVKTYPYQNDITFEEAVKIGLDEKAIVLGTGNDYSGLFPSTYSIEVKKAIDESDLIISKGMAHYETFLYHPIKKPTVFLFKAKCKPVASTLNVPVGSSIILYRSYIS